LKKILMLECPKNITGIFLNLLEYEAKQEFSKFGIPIPEGKTAVDSEGAVDVAAELKAPYMVKAQVLAGGRGKAGGVMPATSLQEVKAAVDRLIGTRIKDLPVREVLIEEKVSVKKEIYLSVTIDRLERTYIALASTMGGIEIEEAAEKKPFAIFKFLADPQLGIHSFNALSIAKQLGYTGSQLVQLSTIIQELYRVCIENDAELVEINPLVETDRGTFVAVDARIVIDDNALFRHIEFERKRDRGVSAQETLASKNNLAYVKLDGDIGVVGNGAGLVMATLDLLNIFGGKPANFLDLGGGANVEAIKTALEIVLADASTKVVLINVLAGITHCDDVAKGIVGSINDAKTLKPLVVRLVGTNQREGQRILEASGIKAVNDMEEAAKQAVKFAMGE
jgi:succinyl-CoA synthetase beta subunit